MEKEKRIFTLSELGKSIRSVIERTYASQYWIKAEIARLNFYPRSGHCYPELVEKSGENVTAQMRAILWASSYKQVNDSFIKIAGRPLEEGMTILFLGSVSFHPMYGLSLMIHEVEPSFTLGEMARDKQQTIEKLIKEGIFDLNKSLPLALVPRRMAIISVETSKGYHDFLNIIKNNSREYAVSHQLFPALLQGDKAVESIVQQLRIIRKVKQHFDLVAIIRGGGGDIGLNCYDHYNLASEVCKFPLPVITGVGHSTNETITEMVAWQNKITPTDVAYFVLEKYQIFEERVNTATRQLKVLSEKNLLLNKKHLEKQQDQLIRQSSLMHERWGYQLEKIKNTISSETRNLLSKQKSLLDSFAVEVAHKPKELLSLQKCSLDIKEAAIKNALKCFLEFNKSMLQKQEHALQLLNPDNVLKRGYSISYLNGKSLLEADDLKDGEIIETRLYSGSFKSKVVANKNQ